MDLTEATKKHIDRLSYKGLLKEWRFSPLGNPWMQGETGKYWSDRMKELQSTVDTAQISKEVGWDG